MKKINVIVIGNGHITKTRHLPVLKGFSNKFIISEIINGRTLSEIKKKICKKKIKAAIVTTPPHTHFSIIKECLNLNLHVLVEKPFVTKISDGDMLCKLAQKKKLLLLTNHNYIFSRSIKLLKKSIEKNALGDITKIKCIHYQKKTDLFPEWTKNLPMGNFYDESVHFLYLLENLFGETKIIKTSFKKNIDLDNTPEKYLLNLKVKNIPIIIETNYFSKKNAWKIVVYGSKKNASINLLRDVLIIDNNYIYGNLTHYLDMLKNLFIFRHFKPLYGFDKIYSLFYKSIIENKNYLENLNCEKAIKINKLQFRIIKTDSNSI